MKKLLKTLALTLALALAVTCIFAGCGEGGDDKDSGKGGDSAKVSSYEVLIETMEEFRNKKTYYDQTDMQVAFFGGFCEDEMKDYIALQKKSEYYDEESAKESFEENIAENNEMYGSDYKFTCKIVDAQAFTDEDLDMYKDDLKDSAKDMEDELSSYEEDSLSEIAEDMGFTSEDDAQEYLDIMSAVAKKYKNAEITDGYHLTVEVTLSGSELEEDEVETETYTAIKIDGCWAIAEMIF